ncbi:DUF4105 domain-containing protein [Teredinibacter sp. KSP-S5-2]|uniref:lipoprotein N-acyltransferase Lnb domain-containing protein n=1 Tax=Teredinibacter sp. KSP-S5-2 TaxID=3034506 RepID=UPI0029342A0F|nr:DUF4105 domain-containing protein [Teredinibacter sp. KSP-S5-2]WNO09482.1 DUF4105 domain-containing protein [Teredinibacter sp. KSP-S5-2]
MLGKLLVGVVLSVVFLSLIFFLLRSPQREGPWLVMQERLPKVTVNQNTVTIENIRDFRYQKNGDVERVQYLTKQYSPDSLQRVWYGLSHFGDHGLAHAFLSFEFSEGEYLVASIEARLKPGQQYHPIKGLFRVYNRMMVLGTEHDIIGLRTHFRKERVLLYPLKLSPEQAHDLWSNILMDTQSIFDTPDFYNTALDNCITGILQYTSQWERFFNRFDYRVLLPGYSDELAYKYQYIDGDGSLPELRLTAQIRDIKTIPLDGSFSARVRAGWQ